MKIEAENKSSVCTRDCEGRRRVKEDDDDHGVRQENQLKTT